jgi:RNA polymerase sigma-70 factor (ECF subfamily)
MSGFPHADAFWSHLPRATALRAQPGMEQSLCAQLDRALSRWPTIEVDRLGFVEHWAAQLAGSKQGLSDFEQLHLEDLYLAFACGRGDKEALRLFRERFVPAAEGAIRGVDNSPSFVDEVLQQLQTRVLVTEADRPPRILDYAGRGSLENWLRAAALRLALNARRDARANPEQLQENSQWDAAAPTGDLQFNLLRNRYGAEFGGALRQSFKDLQPQERNILRLHFVEGLSLNQIAAMYQVNKSTISRRMARARETLVWRTRERLEQQLSLKPSELESLLELLGPRLDLSLTSMLASKP